MAEAMKQVHVRQPPFGSETDRKKDEAAREALGAHTTSNKSKPARLPGLKKKK